MFIYTGNWTFSSKLGYPILHQQIHSPKLGYCSLAEHSLLPHTHFAYPPIRFLFQQYSLIMAQAFRTCPRSSHHRTQMSKTQTPQHDSPSLPKTPMMLLHKNDFLGYSPKNHKSSCNSSKTITSKTCSLLTQPPLAGTLYQAAPDSSLLPTHIFSLTVIYFKLFRPSFLLYTLFSMLRQDL